MIKNRNEEYSGYLVSFGYAVLTAFLIFLPFVLFDQGFFIYAGDFNSQQIPFYTHVNEYLKNGGGTWSWQTDLGSSLINTYSFYLLGSPFFYLTLLFPTRAIPYLMVPLFCLKFGVAALGSYAWLRRYTNTRNMAIVGAMLYTFSGFSIYNIFFNHFIDVIALFPFMLFALDEFVYEKKRGLFPFVVAINLLNNYFFFIGQCVFLLIYFVCMILGGEYKITFKEFLILAFESVLGSFMGIVLVFPTYFNLIENPRVDRIANGFSAIMYYKVQQYFAIFQSAFLPPDPPYLPNMLQDCNIKWTSMSAYLPMVSMGGVIAYLKGKKGSAFRRILLVCFFMAFVPILNSSFYAFNSSYYARWYYMPILIMVLCTVKAIEDSEIDIADGIKTTGIITLGYIVFALMPEKDGDNWVIGVAEYGSRLWLSIILAVVGLIIFYILAVHFRHHAKLSVYLLAAILSFSLVYSLLHMAIAKFPQNEGDADYKSKNYDNIYQLDEMMPQEHFYRIDSYEIYDNISLFSGYPCLQFFNSTVSSSILEFYPSVDIKRDVSSKPEIDKYAMRGLLSCEYLVTYPETRDAYEEEATYFEFEFVEQNENYAIYKNKNFVPMGFVYDKYMTHEEYEKISDSQRGNVLMKAIVLDDEQIKKYGHLLTELLYDDVGTLGYDEYIVDCDERRSMSAGYFEENSSGFEAKITLDSDNLVFFSVPYDKGWSATVNGEDTEVLDVDNGLMAIYAPKGECDIVATYRPVGLDIAIVITICSVGVWIVYVWFMRKKRC